MIWDCFLYNGEKECLEIRMEELKSLDVIHVAVQATKTFTGKVKIVEKIPGCINVIVDDMPETDSAWGREAYQRNAIMRGLTYAKPDDIVIISDADEIPSLEAVRYYKPDMFLAALRMDNFWYRFNYLTEKQKWVAPRIMTFDYLKERNPNDVRNSGYQSEIYNGGHHFSYLGDADFIINKLESYSHQEYNIEKYKNKEDISKKIEDGVALWGGSKFEAVKIDETFPKYLYENQDKFKHLIKQV